MKSVLFIALAFFAFLSPVTLLSKAEVQLLSSENSIRNFQINVPPGLKSGDYLEIRLRHLDGGKVKWSLSQKNTLFKRTIFQKLKAWFFEESAFLSFTGSNVDGTFRGYLEPGVEFGKNGTIIRFIVKRDYSTALDKPINEWTSLLIRELKYKADRAGEIAVEYRLSGLKGYDDWINAFNYKQILVEAVCSLQKEYAFIVKQDSILKESISLLFSIDDFLLKDPDFDTLKVSVIPSSNTIKFIDDVNLKVNFNGISQDRMAYITDNVLHICIPGKLFSRKGKNQIKIDNIKFHTFFVGQDLSTQSFQWSMKDYNIESKVKGIIDIFSIRVKKKTPLMITELERKYRFELPFYSEDLSRLEKARKQLVMEIFSPYTFSVKNREKREISQRTKNATIILKEKTDRKAMLRIRSPNLDNVIEIPGIAYYCQVRNIELQDKFFTNAGVNNLNHLKIGLGDGSGIPEGTELVFNLLRGGMFFRPPDQIRVTYEKQKKYREVKNQVICSSGELRVKVLNKIPPNSVVDISGISIMIPRESFQTRYDSLSWKIPGHDHSTLVSTLYPVKIRAGLKEGTITIVPFLNDPSQKFSLGDIIMESGALADKIFTPGHAILLKLKYRGDIKWVINRLKENENFDYNAISYYRGKQNILKFPIKRKFRKNAILKISNLALSKIKEAFNDLTIELCFDDENSVIARMTNSVKVRSPKFTSLAKQYVFAGDYKFKKYMIEMDFSEVRDFFLTHRTLRIQVNSKSYILDSDSKIKIFDDYGFEITGYDYQIRDNYLEITFSRENVNSLKKFYLANLQLLKTKALMGDETIEFVLLDMSGNVLQKDKNPILVKRQRKDPYLLQNDFMEKMYLSSSGNYFVLQSRYPIFQDRSIIVVDTTILGLSDSTLKRYAHTSPLQNAIKVEFDKGIPVTNQTVIVNNLPLNYPTMIDQEDLRIVVRNWYGFFDIDERDDCSLINLEIKGEKQALEIGSIDLIFNQFDVSNKEWNTYKKLISLHNLILNLENMSGLSDVDFRGRFENLSNKFIEIESLSGIRNWWQYWWIRAFLTSMYIRRFGETGTDVFTNENFYSSLSNAKIRGWVKSQSWPLPPPPEEIPGIVRKFQEALKISRYIEADDYLNQFLRVNLYDYFLDYGYPDFEKGKGGEKSYNRFILDLYTWRALTSIYLEDFTWAGIQINEALPLAEENEYEVSIDRLDSLRNVLSQSNKDNKTVTFTTGRFPEDRKAVTLYVKTKNTDLTDIDLFLPLDDRSMTITYDMPVETYTGQNIKVTINDRKSLIIRNLTFLSIGVGLLIWANY